MGQRGSLQAPGDGHFVVEVVSATGVPKGDLFSESDAFAVVRLVDSNANARSSEMSTLARRNTANPVWHAIRDLRVVPAEGDSLRVEVRDEDPLFDDKLCAGTVPVKELSEEARSFPLTDKCNVVLRRIPYDVRTHARKTVFLLRHGESKWNEALAGRRMGQLFAFDHGLNEKGIRQSRDFNAAWQAMKDSQEPRVRAFMDADAVFCSPLSRAIETAVIGLRGHSVLTERGGIILLSSAREIKCIGGLDTVGEASGLAILARSKAQLAEMMDSKEAAALVDECKFNVHDCVSDWWSPLGEKDTLAELDARFADFLATLQFFPYHTAICCGHSLLFREFCCRYVSPALMQSKPQLAKKLRARKFANATCIAIDIDFNTPSGVPAIVDAELMFGATFSERHWWECCFTEGVE